MFVCHILGVFCCLVETFAVLGMLNGVGWWFLTAFLGERFGPILKGQAVLAQLACLTLEEAQLGPPPKGH